MQYVRREASGLAVIPVKAEADKMARAQGVTPICEAGRVLLPDGARLIRSRRDGRGICWRIWRGLGLRRRMTILRMRSCMR